LLTNLIKNITKDDKWYNVIKNDITEPGDVDAKNIDRLKEMLDMNYWEI
jgi:hypothetical protein